MANMTKILIGKYKEDLLSEYCPQAKAPSYFKYKKAPTTKR